jgi:hypothetical protein
MRGLAPNIRSMAGNEPAKTQISRQSFAPCRPVHRAQTNGTTCLWRNGVSVQRRGSRVWAQKPGNWENLEAPRSTHFFFSTQCTRSEARLFIPSTGRFRLRKYRFVLPVKPTDSLKI